MKNSYKLTYTISSYIVHLISEILKKIVLFKYCTEKYSLPMLCKINRIKTLTWTLKIEGNYIGEDKITAFLESKCVEAAAWEIVKVEGVIRAYG